MESLKKGLCRAQRSMCDLGMDEDLKKAKQWEYENKDAADKLDNTNLEDDIEKSEMKQVQQDSDAGQIEAEIGEAQNEENEMTEIAVDIDKLETSKHIDKTMIKKARERMVKKNIVTEAYHNTRIPISIMSWMQNPFM